MRTELSQSLNTIEKLYRLPELIENIGLKRSSIYQLMAEGRFPKPLKISARAVAWRAGDIAKWQSERAASFN